MSKKNLKRDLVFRNRYKNTEIYNKLNKSFKKSIKFYNISNIDNSNKKKISKVFIRNNCFITGRSRGIVTSFRVSRMVFRKNSSLGMFTGVFKN